MSFYKSFAQRENWSAPFPHLAEFQESCHQKFMGLRLPDKKDESWRYTDLSTLAKSSFHLSQKSLKPSDLKGLKNLNFMKQITDNNILIVENGHLREDLCEIKDPDLKLVGGKALSVKNIQKFIHSETESFFPLMNESLFCDISYLYVPKNTKIDRPVFVIYLSVADGPMNASFPCLLIEVDEGSCLNLSEIHVDTTGTTDAMGTRDTNENNCGDFVNSRTLIHLKKTARLNYLKCQDKGLLSYYYSKVDVGLERESDFRLLSLGLGGLWTRQEIVVRHKEEAASSQVDGLYVSKGESRTECYTSIEHEKGYGSSHQNYRGILSDSARSVFNGRIFIAPQSQKVDSSQMNKNLLLSPDAEVDTKPELEIYADDVKATHGATVGRVNEEEVFYLMSRGIPSHRARYLLTKGFLKGLVGGMEVLEFQKLASVMIENRLKESPVWQ